MGSNFQFCFHTMKLPDVKVAPRCNHPYQQIGQSDLDFELIF